MFVARNVLLFLFCSTELAEDDFARHLIENMTKHEMNERIEMKKVVETLRPLITSQKIELDSNTINKMFC